MTLESARVLSPRGAFAPTPNPTKGKALEQSHTTTYSHSAGSQSVHIASYRVSFLGGTSGAALTPDGPATSPPPATTATAAVTGTPGGAPDGHTKRLRLAARFGTTAALGRSRFWPTRLEVACSLLWHSLHR